MRKWRKLLPAVVVLTYSTVWLVTELSAPTNAAAHRRLLPKFGVNAHTLRLEGSIHQVSASYVIPPPLSIILLPITIVHGQPMPAHSHSHSHSHSHTLHPLAHDPNLHSRPTLRIPRTAKRSSPSLTRWMQLTSQRFVKPRGKSCTRRARPCVWQRTMSMHHAVCLPATTASCNLLLPLFF